MTTISDKPFISTMYDRLLIEDDTEESVAGSDFHLAAILALYEVLLRYAQQAGRLWYVTAEVMVLVDVPERTRNPWRPMPDVYVVVNGTNVPRTSLDTRGGVPFPQFICEVASESTWGQDVGEKQRLYADLGTLEYIVFDPTAEFLRQPLRAWRRQPDGSWGPWEPDAEGLLTSAVLGLRLRAEDALLRVYDAQQGCLPTGQELAEIVRVRDRQLAAQQAQLAAQQVQLAAQQAQLAQERAQRRALEDENAQLKESRRVE